MTRQDDAEIATGSYGRRMIGRWRDMLRTQQVVGVGVVGLVAGVVQAVDLPAGSLRSPVAAGALAVAAILPLAARTRRPLAAFVGCAVLGWTLAILTAAPTPAAAGALLACATVTHRRGRWWSIGCGVAIVAGTGLWIGLVRPDRLTWQALALPAVVVLVVWLAADRGRVRRAYLAELRARAVRTEADRRADTERATATERARIARDLHDVVAHHVSVIAVQAGAVRMLDGQRDDGRDDQHATGAATHEALVAIEAAARQALSELRRLLGVLRSPQDDPMIELAPPPGLHLLGDLVERVQATGLPVDLQLRGTPTPLSPGADLSAYRIVQESLTNVLKHQGPVPTTITVEFTGPEVHLDITDHPEATAPRHPTAARVAERGPTGHGLIGMRERIAMLGGDLHTVVLPDGGFRVQARIPTGDPPC